jgi:hypothetical protein
MIVLLAMSSMVINQKYVLNKVSLSRNTSNKVIYRLLIKMLKPQAQNLNPYLNVTLLMMVLHPDKLILC